MLPSESLEISTLQQGKHKWKSHERTWTCRQLQTMSRYSEHTIKQLRTAGLNPDDELPSASTPLFPHRPLPPSAPFEADPAAGSVEHNEDENPVFPTRLGSAKKTQAKQPQHPNSTAEKRERPDLSNRPLHAKAQVFRAIINRSLQSGNISRAKQAWAILIRSRFDNKPVDLRNGGLWAMGAEILMRDGEDKPASAASSSSTREESVASSPFWRGDDDGNGKKEEEEARKTRRGRRWGRSENLPAVKAYYDALSRRYPYDVGDAARPCALDFDESKFACEIYDAQTEHGIAIRKAEAEAEVAMVGGGGGRRRRRRDGMHHGDDDDDGAGQMRMRTPSQDAEEEDAMLCGSSGNEQGGCTWESSPYDQGEKEEEEEEENWRLQHLDQEHLPGDDAGLYDSRTKKPTPRQLSRLHHPKDRINATALHTARAIAADMDALVPVHPYSRALSFLRLRGVLAAWMADLHFPSPVIAAAGRWDAAVAQHNESASGYYGATTIENSKQERERELEVARTMFGRIEAMGGVVDPPYRRFAREARGANDWNAGMPLGG